MAGIPSHVVTAPRAAPMGLNWGRIAMDIKKRLDEELKRVVEDKQQIRQGFERRASERRKWALPVIEAARALEQETAGHADVIWDIEDMGAGVRLGKPGKRGYRRIQVSVVAPAPGHESANFVMRQTNTVGKQLAETDFDLVDDVIEALIKAVGEHAANPLIATSTEGDTTDDDAAGSSGPGGATGVGPRTLTYILAGLLGLFALLAGWYLVATLQAGSGETGTQAIGGLWERLSALLK